MRGRQAILDAATSYLRRHPEEITRALRGALGLRLGVPVRAVQWLADRAEGGPEDVVFEAVPPRGRVAATLDLMGARVRASSCIFVERVDLSEERLRAELRLEETRMDVLDGGDSPVAALIESGALDLTKAGSLAAHLPEVKKVTRESHDNRLVIDLSDHPMFRNPLVRRAVGLVSAFVTLRGVESDAEHVDLAFRAFPRGLRGAAGAVRRHVLAPARPWIRGMLGAGRP